MNDLKTKVCIPVFNGSTGEINVIKTKHHDEYFRDYKLPAHEVALSSSSAPIYFPPHSFNYSNEHGEGANVNMIDGGIFANNPSLIGVLEAIDKLGKDIGDIKILSLGTGKGKHVVRTGWRPKDIWYWLFPNPRLLDIILDSQSQITEQYMAFFNRIATGYGKGFGYLRVQYDLGTDVIGLNASSKKEIQKLEAIGGELSKNNLANILKFINPK